MVRLSELLKACGISKTEHTDGGIFVTGGNTDSRLIIKGSIYFALKGNNFDGHDFVPQACGSGASVCVVSDTYNNEGNYPVIYSDDVEKTLGQLAMQWRKLHNAKIIGITGTNGKTTTKEILGKILSVRFNIISTFKNFNNHIGVPLTLLSIKDETEYAIVELGTNHFGEIEYLSTLADPDMGLITNIGEGHLEQFRDKKGVYEEKIKLFRLLENKNAKIFLNIDDELLKDWRSENTVTFSLEDEAKYTFTDIKTGPDGYPSFRFRGADVKMNIPGSLNIKNALAAAAVASELGISPEKIASVLSTVTLSDKRYETVRYKNSSVLLDCYNANPSSTENFLEDIASLGSYNTVVLGDMLELGATSNISHERIVNKAAELNFDEVLLTGEEMNKALKNFEGKSNITHYEDFTELKKRFDEIAGSGRGIAVKGSRGMKLEKLLEEI
ncbi:MAG: UDP-N-acetylmuramoyl-tripeptide--D-alanyl-D-alanine ligase [Candidatus Delongbacteria bacterium]